MDKIQMFCIPYAGGSSIVYSSWKDKVRSDIEVIPLEYSGHGRRIMEALYLNMNEVAEDMCKIIEDNIRGEYVIYGHSMGAFVAFETAYKLSKKDCIQPQKIMIAGVRPPHLLYKDKKYTKLLKNDFMKAIYDMGEIPEEIYENEESYELYYEILFNDFKIIEEYRHDNNCGLLKIPMIILTGDNDKEAPEACLAEWANYAGSYSCLKVLQGNHFFAFHKGTTFFELLNSII